LGIKQEAKEQIAEGLVSADSLFSTNSIETENILGQNMYQQILQNIFPAGKDANSGLNGEQIALSVVQEGMGKENLLEALKNSLLGEDSDINKYLVGQISTDSDPLPKNNQTSLEKTLFDTVLPLKDIGLEGIKSSISREISSLSPAELDKYIGALELLKGLSGQITLTDSQKPILNDLANVISYLINQQQAPGKESVDQVKVTGILSAEKNPVDFSVKTEGSNGQALTKDTDKKAFGDQNLENQDLEEQTLDNKKLAEMNNSFTAKYSSVPASTEESPFKTEPQLIIPGQHAITKTESTPIADKATLNPDQFNLNSGKIWDQVMTHLRKQEYSQVKELSIQLHPADLGKVNFSVRLENGQVHMVINATESSTANFLQNNLSDLRSGLSQSGVDCGSLEMGFNDSGYGSNRDFNSEEKDSLPILPEEERTYYPGFVSAMSNSSSGSRINVKA